MKLCIELLMLILVSSGLSPLASACYCVWNRDTDFSQYPSLLMENDTWRSILPILSGTVREIRIPVGSTVVIACPKRTIIATGTEVAEGICNEGNILDVGGTQYNMTDLGCTSVLKESIMKNVGPCGDGDEGELSVIGYDITGYDFYKLIEVCFDPVFETAFYTYHVLRGESASASDGNPSKPSFRTSSGFYTVSPNKCYPAKAQSQLMEAILGNSTFISLSKRHYLARGHLAPNADFFADMEADATYYYINVVPQWQRVNNGNWKYMETAVRDLASSHANDLKIWTGTWEVLKMDDVNNNPVEIYLGLYLNEEVLPAPELIWKVIYEPSSEKGVAIIVVNNPYVTSFPTKICTDICDQITWIDFDVNELEKGATYCCTVEDLHSVVPNAPDLGSVGILTN